MNEKTDKTREAFHLLDRLGSLERHEIEKHFSSDNFNSISTLIDELSDEKNLLALASPANFSKLILELREIKRFWGRKLGDAIIAADEKAASKDIDGAISILEHFIKNCTSPFHRKHAQNQIQYYTKNK